MSRFNMLWLMMLASLTAYSQNKLTGKVVDQGSFGLAANVYIQGTTIEGYSDATTGAFTIPIPDSLVNKEIVLGVEKEGYLINKRMIEGEYRHGKPVIIMLSPVAADSTTAPPPPPPPPPPPQPTEQIGKIPSFPWPPPEYSVAAVLDKNYFKRSKTLSDVDGILTAALSGLKYDDRAYFQIPNGFALVTRIEQIREDGKPYTAPARWSVKVMAYDRLSWSSYMKALVFPPKGYFRIIVFAVTDQPFTSSQKKATRAVAEQWLKAGVTELPASIREKKFGPGHRCTALIYEFKKVEANEAEQITGSLTGAEHLRKSGLIPLVKAH